MRLPEVVPLALPNPLLLPASFLAGDPERASAQWLPLLPHEQVDSVWRMDGQTRAVRTEVRVHSLEPDHRAVSKIELRERVTGALESELSPLDYRRTERPQGVAGEWGPAAGWSFRRTGSIC